MSETKQSVEKILTEIERGTEKEGSIDDVAEKLLGHKNTYGIELYDNSAVIRSLREKAHIQYGHPITSHHKIIGKPIIFIRRFYRKLMCPIIQPIIDDQNRFNDAVVDAIAQLMKNEHD